MKIVAYSYDAEIHCIDCAVNRFATPNAGCGQLDENGVPSFAIDHAGDRVEPIYRHFEAIPCGCATCGETIS